MSLGSLSKYNKTLELKSIADDKLNSIINSEQDFERIVNLFLNKLKLKDDKYLAIKYLISIFPENTYLIEQMDNLNGYTGWIKNLLTDYGLQKNISICDQYDNLYSVRQNKNWKRLNKLLEEETFLKVCQLPTSLQSQKIVFEKLQIDSFRIIDLIIQCRNSTFQLNSIILKNLIFFFFIPDKLDLNNQEKKGLYQILGEILCNLWIQFEYHCQQLKDLNQGKQQLISLQEILTQFKTDPSKLYEYIQFLMQLQQRKYQQIISQSENIYNIQYVKY